MTPARADPEDRADLVGLEGRVDLEVLDVLAQVDQAGPAQGVREDQVDLEGRIQVDQADPA